MLNKVKRSKWQRGQALAEYSILIPAGIFIMLTAAVVVQFITGGLQQAVNGLKPSSGLECEVEPEIIQEGPESVQLGCLAIELVARSYDETNDRTTVAYQVTDTCGSDLIDACVPYDGAASGKSLLCHKAGLASGPANSIVLDLPESAIRAHLDDHGTPLAGHEEDFLIETQEDYDRCLSDGKNNNDKNDNKGNNPTESRWVLGMSKDVADQIVSSSAEYAYGKAPTTSVTGLKFGLSQECSGLEAPSRMSICHIAGLASDPANYILMENMPLSAYHGHFDEHGTTQAGHEEDFIITSEEDRQRCLAGPDNVIEEEEVTPGKGKDKKTSGIMLTSFESLPLSTYTQSSSGDSTTILLTLAGYYNWSLTTVAVDTGTEVYEGVITAPVSQTTPDDAANQCPE